MSTILMVSQRPAASGRADDAPWIVDGGIRVPGQDGLRRLRAIASGLLRHDLVTVADAGASDALVDAVLRALHSPEYLSALRATGDLPVTLPRFTAPGLQPDIPVSAPLVAAAHEAVRAAITAARAVAGGATPYAYAMCRPPGHHAGPSWCGGYCYLNTAAAAAQTLRTAGAGPIGILDIDLHYPNGTSAIVASMGDVALHSLHAWPVTNAPEGRVLPRTGRERLVEFRGTPDADTYLEAVDGSVTVLAQTAHALVLSLGFDTIAGDPHGSWGFSPLIFTEVGRILAATGLPICIVQEGGYAVDLLADCSHAFASGLLAEIAVA
jgi:acetoin utilization deacetylase AcuC-like enzyme